MELDFLDIILKGIPIVISGLAWWRSRKINRPIIEVSIEKINNFEYKIPALKIKNSGNLPAKNITVRYNGTKEFRKIGFLLSNTEFSIPLEFQTLLISGEFSIKYYSPGFLNIFRETQYFYFNGSIHKRKGLVDSGFEKSFSNNPKFIVLKIVFHLLRIKNKFQKIQLNLSMVDERIVIEFPELNEVKFVSSYEYMKFRSLFEFLFGPGAASENRTLFWILDKNCLKNGFILIKKIVTKKFTYNKSLLEELKKKIIERSKSKSNLNISVEIDSSRIFFDAINLIPSVKSEKKVFCPLVLDPSYLYYKNVEDENILIFKDKDFKLYLSAGV